MPSPILIRRLYAPGEEYLLYDGFDVAQAAPLNGRIAIPGPGGAVTYRDVESKISIVGGIETWAAQATPVYADQDRVYDQLPITRAFGVVVICKWRLTTDNPVYPLALVTSTTPTWNHTHVEAGFWRSAALSLAIIHNATLGPVVATIAVDTDYLLLIELRAAGWKGYIRGGAFAVWTKLFETALGSTATLYVASAGYTAVWTLDDIRTPSRKFFDVPLASDSFAGANGTMTGRVPDGLGHAEQNGGGGLAWTTPGDTWTIASNAAVNTPTQGAELLTDGGLEVWASATDLTSWVEALAGTSTVNREATTIHGGTYAARFDLDGSASLAQIVQIIASGGGTGTWLRASAWLRGSDAVPKAYMRFNGAPGTQNVKDLTTSYVQHFITARSLSATPNFDIVRNSGANKSIYIDDISVTALTLSSLFSSLILSTVNITGEWVIKTLVAGTQAGCVLRLDDPDSPANFLLLYWDGAGNIKLDECVAGVYTNLLDVVKAYATGDKLVPWLNGSAWRIYHVTAAGVATLLGSGSTSVLTGNWIGNFSTYSGNAIESCNAYAAGTEGQYSELNLF